MKSFYQNTYPPAKSLRGATAGQLNFTIIYWDHTGVHEVANIQKRILDQLGPHYSLHRSAWPIEALHSHSVFETARRQAAADDLLFLVLPAAGELSFEFKAWLELVLAEFSGDESALVLLLGTTNGAAVPGAVASQYLHERASRAGVNCLVNWYPLPPKPPLALNPNLHEQVTATATTAGLPFRPKRARNLEHWGINE